MKGLIERLSEAKQVAEGMDPGKVADELEDIQQEMLELLYRAKQLVRGTRERSRAEAYWLAHINSSLGGEGGNRYDVSMQTTIEELRASAEDEEK